jgi:WD40 repeat protein
MESQQIYTLQQQARCVHAIVSDTDRNRFVVGTCSLREDNELHIIEYIEGASDVKCDRIFAHPKGELWSIAPSPADDTLLATVYNRGGTYGASLWSMAGSTDGDGTQKLQELASFGGHSRQVCTALWSPVEDGSSIITLDNSHLRHWDVAAAASAHHPAPMATGEASLAAITAAAWDPHHANQVGVASGENVYLWDMRTCKESSLAVRRAHVGKCRDIDYNPNKPNAVVTCGDDGGVSFWDLRKGNEPLLRMPGPSRLSLLTPPTHGLTTPPAAADRPQPLGLECQVQPLPRPARNERVVRSDRPALVRSLHFVDAKTGVCYGCGGKCCVVLRKLETSHLLASAGFR